MSNWFLLGFLVVAVGVGCKGRPPHGGDDDDDDDNADGDADTDSDSDSDSDADIDADTDSDVDADVDADSDSDSDADTDSDADVDADTDSDSDVDADGDADVSTVGDACDSDNDCEGTGAECLTEADAGWLDGYCVASCGADECPTGTVCWDDLEICLAECNGDGDCRPGYVCGGYLFGAAIPDGCVMECQGNIPCGNGYYCDDGDCLPSGGNRGVWEACTDDECEGLCLVEEDFGVAPPDNYTSVCSERCDPANDTCPVGSRCLEAGIGLCFPDCEGEEDCPFAWDSCVDPGDGQRACTF